MPQLKSKYTDWLILLLIVDHFNEQYRTKNVNF